MYPIHNEHKLPNGYSEASWADRLENMVLATEKDPEDVAVPQKTVEEVEDGNC